MKLLKKSILFFSAWLLMMTRTVLASEEIKKANMISESEIYLKAFYAAFATLLIMFIISFFIFKPRFKGSDDKF